MLALMLFLGLSLAQEPAATPAVPAPPPQIEQVASTATLTRDVTLVRWPDGDAAVTSLPAGTEVEVVMQEGDKIRVRKDLDFGWVAADAVGTQAPAALPDSAASGDAASGDAAPADAPPPADASTEG